MLLSSAFAAATPSPFDDRWYQSGSYVYMGDRSIIDNDAPLKVSTVWRAVNVIAGAIADLPIDVFKRLPKRKGGLAGGKEIAEKDPWRMNLRGSPNRVQTTYTWRHHLVGQLLLNGNYYALKMGSNQLWPLDPTRMKVKRIERDGSLVYEYNKKSGVNDLIKQDDLVHIRGYSKDGLVGVSVIDQMRDLTALALSNRRQRATFVRNEMRPSVVVKHPGELGDKGKENLTKGYKRAFGGPTNAGEVLVLDEGMDITAFAVHPADAQYIESEHFLVEEFLRMLGVPGVLVGLPHSASGLGTEVFFQSFATYTVHPIVRNIETALTAALYGDEQDEVFVELNLGAMMRPDAKTRAEFYNIMVTLGIFTRNEVRELENRDPLEGLDEPLTPLNMGGAPGGVTGPSTPPTPGAPKRGPQKGYAIVVEAAARLVRKEVAALQSLAKKYAAEPDTWVEQLAAFYAKHACLVAAVLHLDPEQAVAYCERQREALAADLYAMEGWESTRPAELVALALPPGDEEEE